MTALWPLQMGARSPVKPQMRGFFSGPPFFAVLFGAKNKTDWLIDWLNNAVEKERSYTSAVWSKPRSMCPHKIQNPNRQPCALTIKKLWHRPSDMLTNIFKCICTVERGSLQTLITITYHQELKQGHARLRRLFSKTFASTYRARQSPCAQPEVLRHERHRKLKMQMNWSNQENLTSRDIDKFISQFQGVASSEVQRDTESLTTSPFLASLRNYLTKIFCNKWTKLP